MTAADHREKALMVDELGGRLLAFDRPVTSGTLQIAGIAAARRGALTAGNTRDFEWTGVALVDPWSAFGGR